MRWNKKLEAAGWVVLCRDPENGNLLIPEAAMNVIKSRGYGDRSPVPQTQPTQAHAVSKESAPLDDLKAKIAALQAESNMLRGQRDQAREALRRIRAGKDRTDGFAPAVRISAVYL